MSSELNLGNFTPTEINDFRVLQDLIGKYICSEGLLRPIHLVSDVNLQLIFQYI